MRRLALVAVAAFAFDCGPSALPPVAEALVFIDTDLTVPKLASAARIDIYRNDGTWASTRQFLLPRVSSWPASFSVTADAPDAPLDALVRVRVFQEGHERDYLGERFAPRPMPNPTDLGAIVLDPVGDGTPRLMQQGVDVTPPTEPEPLAAVDVLVRVHADPHERGRIDVVARGACAGTMVDLANRTTCIDHENVRIDAPQLPLGPWRIEPNATQSGAFETGFDCTGTPRAERSVGSQRLFNGDVCIAGGAFVFGARDRATSDFASAMPERIAVIPPFFIDRYEVTVARYRDALARGFAGHVVVNDGPLPTVPSTTAAPDPVTLCSFSSADLGRESHALTCVNFQTARAFCRFEGGDLPTEAQWEYAATTVGSITKRAYPWADPSSDVPCSRAVFGRDHDYECWPSGYGPLPVDAADRPDGDRAVATGVVGLGGGVREITLDRALSLSSNCWRSQGLVAPACQPEDADLPYRTMRGGYWDFNARSLYASNRAGFAVGLGDGTIGFRCVRPAR